MVCVGFFDHIIITILKMTLEWVISWKWLEIIQKECYIGTNLIYKILPFDFDPSQLINCTNKK